MKNTYLFLVVSMLVFSLALAGCKGPSTGNQNPLSTAEETVRAFCDLDAEGTRLTSTTWPKVLPYISWQEEPGWDSVVVISGYKITNTLKQSQTLEKVTVEYQVLGKLSKDYVKEKAARTVTFTLRKTKAGWKIKSPDFLPPHVLPSPLGRHLEETKNREMPKKVQEAE